MIAQKTTAIMASFAIKKVSRMQSNIKVRNNVDNDDKRFCHIFIKDCMDEDYTGFFQTAGYTEKKLLLRVIQNSIAFLIQQ